MILVPHYYFQGQKGPIYWIFFKVRKVQFRSLLHILSIYLFKIGLVNILLIFGMELLQDSANLRNCEETYFIETLKIIFKVRFGYFSHISLY